MKLKRDVQKKAICHGWIEEFPVPHRQQHGTVLEICFPRRGCRRRPPTLKWRRRRWQATATDDRREEPRGRIQKLDATRFKRMRTRQRVASPVAAGGPATGEPVANRRDPLPSRKTTPSPSTRTRRRTASGTTGRCGFAMASCQAGPATPSGRGHRWDPLGTGWH
jgi:hypothetical protein